MTYKTHRTYQVKYGGYRNLQSYQSATIIYDLTIEFCNLYMSYKTNKSYRTYDQMTQAARSGKQNIVEGSQASRTSKKTELKLVGVARASLEELLQDYEDFLRQRNLLVWSKDDPRARAVRALAYKSDKSYTTYKSYLSDPEQAANCLLTLLHQANYLLDRQFEALQKAFIEEGGFTENLYKNRLQRRKTV